MNISKTVYESCKCRMEGMHPARVIKAPNWVPFTFHDEVG